MREREAQRKLREQKWQRERERAMQRVKGVDEQEKVKNKTYEREKFKSIFLVINCR